MILFLLISWFSYAYSIDPICSFIAATNVGGFAATSMWMCNSTGTPMTDPCSSNWTGIMCNGNDATSDIISINVTGLSGSLCPAIGSFSQLQELQLPVGRLTGSIPGTVGSLSAIQFFNLNNNSLTGSIPVEILDATSLSSLHLAANLINGSIPELNGLTRLVDITLADNRLTGSLPAMGSLQVLTALLMFENKLVGTAPSYLGALPALEELGLSDNHFVGKLPDLSALSRLKAVALGGNNFTGSVPSAWCALTNIEILGISVNSLSGTLPSCLLRNLSQLVLIGVNNNLLTGTLPAVVGNLTALRQLYLDDNLFTGTLSGELMSFSALNLLDVGSNRLTGSLPSSIGAPGSLTGLFVGTNSLTGTIPPEISACSNLSVVYFSYNSITGTLPAVMGGMRSIVGIMAGFNNFEGTIPSALACLSGLQVLGLQSTQIGGAIPSEFCSSAGMLIDVVDTNIHCLSGCLKVSDVFVMGIDPNCHDGSIMRRFLTIAGIVLLVLLLASLCMHQLGSNKALVNAAKKVNGAFVALFSSAEDIVRVARQSIMVRMTSARATEVEVGPTPFAWLGQSAGFVVLMSIFKLSLVVAFTFTINNWWSYGPNSSGTRNAESVDSCTNSKSTGCRSYCSGNTEIITVSVEDDFLSYGSGSSREEHYSYCVANFPGGCAYDYWMVFKLAPLCAHILQFILQCATLWRYRDFVPQQLQYDLVIAYLFPSHQSFNPSGCPLSVVEMVMKLNELPVYSVFALLEVGTAVYVWGELLYPPVYCGEVRPLSMYYYPILMTLFDIGKLNVYTASRFIQISQMCEGCMGLLSFHILWTNLWTSVVLTVLLIHHCAVQIWWGLWGLCGVSKLCGSYRDRAGGAGTWDLRSTDALSRSSSSTLNPISEGLSDLNPTGIRLTDVERGKPPSAVIV